MLRKIFSLTMAVLMALSIAPLSLALPTKDADLNAVMNGEGTDLVFENDASNPWEIVEMNGLQYAKSTIAGMDNTEAAITTRATVQAGATISFDYKVSSEPDYDVFIFGYITADNPQGVIELEAHGNMSGTFSTIIPATDEYTFVWVYRKDRSSGYGEDCAYVRNVTFGEAETPNGINIVGDEIKMLVGRTETLSVEFDPSHSFGVVSWSSSDDSIATVDNGIVTGLRQGNVTITATCGELSDSIVVRVVDPDTMRSLDAFRVRSRNADPVSRVRIYLHSDGSAIVEELPFSLGAGDVTAAAYYNGDLYVVRSYRLLKVNVETGVAEEVATCGMIRGMSYDYVNDRMLCIISDEATMAQYVCELNLQTGELTRLSIVAMNLLTIAVAPNGDVYSMELSTGKLVKVTPETGETKLIMETGYSPEYLQSMTFDYRTGLLYWAACSLTDESLYVIDVEARTMELAHHMIGELTGLYTTTGNVTESVPVTGITLDTESATIEVETTTTITPLIAPMNASDNRVTWQSSNPAVASVTNGVVKGMGKGTATITATTVDGGFTASCEITVTGDYLLYEDFEDELVGWENIDADGDGYYWRPMSEFGIPAYEGNDMYTSQSFDNGDPDAGITSIALYPDNWLISPEFTIPVDATENVLSWIAGSQDPDFLDRYTVYIGSGDAEPETFTEILFQGEAPATPHTMRIDLMPYSGQTVRIAFRHNSGDKYMLNLDMVKVRMLEGETIPVTGVTLNSSDETIEAGQSITLTATVMPENASNPAITWSSSNNSVAVVNNGVVTGISAGTAVITVTTAFGGYRASCNVTVTGGDDVIVDELYEDFEDELEGWTIIDADGDGHTWMFMNDYSSVIEAYEGTNMFTSQSYINAPELGQPGTILDPDNWLISPQFKVPADAASCTLSWIAGSQFSTLDHYSVYIGVGAAVPETFSHVLYSGTAPETAEMLTASLMAYAGQTVRIAFRHHDSRDCFMLNLDMIQVTTSTTPGPGNVPVTGVTLDSASKTLHVGETATLVATVLPENATNKNVRWSSSNDAIATVSNGVITAVAPGTAIITVTTVDGSFRATCTVTVVDEGEIIPVTGIALDVESAVMTVGGELAIQATITPDNATNQTITWTSSDESVATVVDGVVTAVAPGEVTITATVDDVTVTCTIKVYLKGDVTGDGMVNTGDAVAMLRKIAGLGNSGMYVAEIEDYNADGMFNTGDAVAVLRKIAGLEE